MSEILKQIEEEKKREEKRKMVAALVSILVGCAFPIIALFLC